VVPGASQGEPQAVQTPNQPGSVVIAVVATALLRDRAGIDLRVENQAEQEIGATVLDTRRGPATASAGA
jgi:hypothetical protein